MAADSLANAAEAEQSALSIFVGTSLDQILLHIALVALVGGIGTTAGVRVLGSSLRKSSRAIDEQSAFVILITLLAISMAVVVALFEGLVTTLGDDHSNRVITRYYEFLFPFFGVLAFGLTNLAVAKWLARGIQFVILLALSIVVLARFPAGIETSFADSVLLKGLLIAPGVVVFIFVIVLLGSTVWFFSEKVGSRLIAWFVLPSVLVTTGLVAQADLITTVGYQKAYFDVAGQATRDQLRPEADSKVVVVGQTRAEVFTAMFWMNRPGIREVLLNSETKFDLSTVTDADYVLAVGPVELQGTSESVLKGDGYQLVRVR